MQTNQTFVAEPKLNHAMNLNNMSHASSSHFDDRLDDLANIVEMLIVKKGVYHMSIHFSSSQLVCWTYDNPYSYQIYSTEEVFSTGFMRFFSPLHPKIHTCIKNNMVAPIYQALKNLRKKVGVNELRNASIHMINGYIGLSFSCDDTRYINYKDLLL